MQVVRDLTLRYWPLVKDSSSANEVFREFCRELERSGAIYLETTNVTAAEPSIFISNHPSVIEPLKIFFDNTYSLPYHNLLLDYVVERSTGRPVSHISADPQRISPFLRQAAERLGYLLVDPGVSPKGWAMLSRRVAETLSAGRHISLAPEGRFHAWNSVGPFRRGFYHWALENSASVIPVRLGGFETLGPRLEVRFAAPEKPSPALSATGFVADIRERVFGKEFGLTLL